MGEQKEREIEQLEMKIAEMKDEVTSQKATIKRLKIYQKFMDKVLEHTDEVFRLDVYPKLAKFQNWLYVYCAV